ncbi:MAG TPA: spore cortex biosynthesis protein YabQ [Candidatus Sulfotelmatobacter sp.]|nr:spore cortex biosynthesis protein YabQ [Candidatus Sulfotelmatobacter sp.]
MQRLDLQFYGFFMNVLCGAVLGTLFDLLRVARGHYRPNLVLAAAADLLFWGVATLALSSALFYGNWGEIRFYVVVALLMGIGMYYWLASPVVQAVYRAVIGALEWMADLIATLIMRLIVGPVVWIAGLAWAGAQTLARWVMALGKWLWRLLERLGGWLLTPLIGPYRFMKLHYLLTKRRLKRRLRHWLLGPPTPPKR